MEKETSDISKLEPFIIIKYNLKNLKPVKKIEVSHKLFGHEQRKNNKVYTFGGIVKSMKGEKVGKGGLLIPAEHKEDIIRFLDSYSIRYEIIEVYKK